MQKKKRKRNESAVVFDGEHAHVTAISDDLDDQLEVNTTVATVQSQQSTRKTVVIRKKRPQDLHQQSTQTKLAPQQVVVNNRLAQYTNPNEGIEGYCDTTFIGYGSFGVVFQATQKRLHRLVALKRINLEKQSIEWIISEVEFLFDRTMQHDRLVRAYNCFTRPDTRGQLHLWVAMELMDGDSLRTLLDTSLTEAQMAAILKEVLCALAFLHSHVSMR